MNASGALRDLLVQLRELREQQRGIERSRAHYADLFDFAPVMYALLDPVGMILKVNLAGSRLLNTERAHLIGHPLLAFVLPGDRREFLEHLRRCRSEKGIVESEIRFVSRERTVTCRLYSKRAGYEGGDALPTVIIDQTERLTLDEARLRAERAREQAEREAEVARSANAAKDDFLATVSHELRTPLTPALIAASRLAGWDPLPDHARKLAETIKRNIEFEARLIDDLLDIARISRERISLRLETVDLHEVIAEAIRICEPNAEGKNIELNAQLIAPAHHVSADRARLRQVFWNLLENAVKFSEPRGRVMVRTASASDSVVRVAVRDYGAGMDASQLEKLFTPFDRGTGIQTSRGGLGLGLSICKGIIAAHGGQIWASSDGPGLGSTFAVELTTVPAPEVAPIDRDWEDAALHAEGGHDGAFCSSKTTRTAAR